MGMNAKIKKENELDQHDINDIDLVISIGGDSTYLKAAGIILNNELPIYGINSDPTRRTGALCNESLIFQEREQQIPVIIEQILAGEYSSFYRNRAWFTIENPVTGMQTNKLCLNEVFAAEKDVSCTSMYRVQVDGRDMGKFKSSGLLIGTGTGSSGWLYSARQVTNQEVSTIQSIIGTYDNSELVRLNKIFQYLSCIQVNSNISGLISSNNVFPYDSDKLYYLVREGYVSDPSSYTWRAEGYCSMIKVISEIIDGSVQIDGYFKYDIGIGDVFTVESCPQKSLRCIRLNKQYEIKGLPSQQQSQQEIQI
ncbi:nad kinase domain-containing protein 1-like [Stylonychia lemnae]|uniref:Nad kinase domain-containing protein 1-like n=1 Tax=Stylonychia lemnae TaxID=5949 RepID=A0A077ZWE3_STYLE|nr:nad kinase domain-containing protein 1-like [Stylonychia lemnae]|eukprot:CDW73590.1 nad kinase domain-containing protein 1-like [Stylonychia lemnae]